jgi:NACalpha-BTF3-like transcription factor
MLICRLLLRPSLMLLFRSARELSQVKVAEADIDLVSKELEIPSDKAELLLRQNKGDAAAAFRAFLAA